MISKTSRKDWDSPAQNLYYREASSFEAKKHGKKWGSYFKLSEHEKDFWRAKAQAYSQNYPGFASDVLGAIPESTLAREGETTNEQE